MHQINVLLVEDEEIELGLLRHVVEEISDGNIYAFSNSLEAHAFVSTAQEQDIDLVICDWQMPNLNGLEFLKEFRLRFAYTPFLMVTANCTMDLVMEAKHAGASGFIAKPYSAQVLAEKMKAIIS